MTQRFYPALIVQDDAPAAGFGVVFPDLPGCASNGGTVQEAAVNAAEALSLHIEGLAKDGDEVPPPSALDAPLPDWLAGVPRKIVAHVLVPVEMPGRSMQIDITLDEGLLARLDAASAASGMSRSDYIAGAVRACLRPVA